MSVYVIGGGGHAKVVVATLQAAGTPVAGVLDDDPTRHGQAVLGVPVLGPVALAREVAGPVVIAVGDNAARRRIADALDGAVAWATAVHPHACVHPSVRLGEGTVVFAGVVVQPDAALGRHAIVNTSASVDHDCRLGDFVHIAPGVRLAGSVRLGEGVFLGVGSSVLPGREVGAWTTVGGGGVVVYDLPAHVVAVGVPARPRTVGRTEG
ncbi:MAG TPA: acetyltransferase [Rhodothermales bacterium]|nr:acetyltransferase [Rhodothermales bacterium]